MGPLRSLAAIAAVGWMLAANPCFADSLLGTYNESFVPNTGSVPNGSYITLAAGTAPGGSGTVYSGEIGNEWSFQGTNDYQARVFGFSGRGNVLVLDDSQDGDPYSQTQAIVEIDLDTYLGAGWDTTYDLTDIEISFDHYDSNDEQDPLAGSSSNPTGDGVLVSADGVNWTPLVNLGTTNTSSPDYQSNQTWRYYDRSVATGTTGVVGGVTTTFYVMLSQYDNYEHGTDGRKFDHFKVEFYGNALPASQSPVPEPATATLFGIGMLGLGLRRRRKARATSDV